MGRFKSNQGELAHSAPTAPGLRLGRDLVGVYQRVQVHVMPSIGMKERTSSRALKGKSCLSSDSTRCCIENGVGELDAV